MSSGLLLLLCLTQTPPSAANGSAAPSAEELIARVHDRYAHCTTFRDHGRCRRRYGNDSLGTDEREYLLAFERPDRFRFEHGKRSTWEYRGEETVWRARDDWSRWEQRESQPAAVTPREGQDAFGMFDVFAEWIVPLLEAPDLHGEFQRDPWKEARPVGEVVRAPIDGVERWCISFEFRDDRDHVWIGDDGAIVRVATGTAATSRVSDELDLAPEFDVALDPSDLALSPPGASGVKPSVVMHALMILGVVSMGTIGVLLGLRLQQTGRPFTVSPNLIGWFAAAFGGAELLARFVDHIDLFHGVRASTLILAPVIAAGAWPVLKHLRREFGFHVVGVDHATFLTALRAVAAGLDLPTRISAATPKVTIDGRTFDVAARPTWSMFGLLTKEKGSRELLDRLRPLVAACFEGDALPTRRHAGLRIIAWSSAMIVGAIFLGGFLFTLFDFM